MLRSGALASPAVRIPVLTALVAALALSAAAAPALAATHTVYAGAPPALARQLGPHSAIEITGYFPDRIEVHTGDSIRWIFTGRYHMVTIPTTTGVRPLFGWVNFDKPFSGFADAAGRPFWFDGTPEQYVPLDGALRDGAAPFDGTRPRNSGLPAADGHTKPYTVQFVKPGTFLVLCIVHPTMHMTVNVIAKGAPLERGPTKADQLDYAKKTLSTVRRMLKITPPARTVYAGWEEGDISLLRFFPAVETVRAGQSVDFVLRAVKESHNVAFGPPAYLRRISDQIIQRRVDPDGKKVFVLNPELFLPSDPENAFPAFDGRNHGNGFLNTGAFDNDPLTPYDDHQIVRFTRPGTYLYECLIHPGMTAKVRVLPRAA
jgi:plastocyanin